MCVCVAFGRPQFPIDIIITLSKCHVLCYLVALANEFLHNEFAINDSNAIHKILGYGHWFFLCLPFFLPYKRCNCTIVNDYLAQAYLLMTFPVVTHWSQLNDVVLIMWNLALCKIVACVFVCTKKWFMICLFSVSSFNEQDEGEKVNYKFCPTA